MKKLAFAAILAVTFCGGCGSGAFDITVEPLVDKATIKWNTSSDTTGLIKIGETPEYETKIYEDSESTFQFYQTGWGAVFNTFLVILFGSDDDDYEDDEYYGYEEDDYEDYDHSVIVGSLRPGTTYYFRIKTVTLDGNVRESDMQSFTTKWY